MDKARYLVEAHVIADQNIRVIDLDGQLIRELTLDPSHTYQPLARP